jgi:hypothetical protein
MSFAKMSNSKRAVLRGGDCLSSHAGLLPEGLNFDLVTPPYRRTETKPWTNATKEHTILLNAATARNRDA